MIKLALAPETIVSAPSSTIMMTENCTPPRAYNLVIFYRLNFELLQAPTLPT